jgi:hypothetical protein
MSFVHSNNQWSFPIFGFHFYIRSIVKENADNFTMTFRRCEQ